MRCKCSFDRSDRSRGCCRSPAGACSEGAIGHQGDRSIINPQCRVERGRKVPGDLDGLGRGGDRVPLPQCHEVGVAGDRTVKGGLQADRLAARRAASRVTRDRRAVRAAGSRMGAIGALMSLAVAWTRRTGRSRRAHPRQRTPLGVVEHGSMRTAAGMRRSRRGSRRSVSAAARDGLAHRC